MRITSLRVVSTIVLVATSSAAAEEFPMEADAVAYFSAHDSELNQFVDDLTSETAFHSIICSPDKAELEPGDDVMAVSGEGDDEIDFYLEGARLAKYQAWCDLLKIYGARPGPDGMQIQFDMAKEQSAIYRIDLLRKSSAALPYPNCSDSLLHARTGICDRPIAGRWSIRYYWNSDQDFEALYVE